jgi:hypothetical protein
MQSMTVFVLPHILALEKSDREAFNLFKSYGLQVGKEETLPKPPSRSSPGFSHWFVFLLFQE